MPRRLLDLIVNSEGAVRPKDLFKPQFGDRQVPHESLETQLHLHLDHVVVESSPIFKMMTNLLLHQIDLTLIQILLFFCLYLEDFVANRIYCSSVSVNGLNLMD